MNAFFARQPILDVNLKLYGYEMLFRANPEDEAATLRQDVQGDRATATVLEAINARGIEKVTGGRMAFVNFTERLLLEGVAANYPSKYLTIEVLETVRSSREVLKAVVDLKAKGYTIALDDYVFDPGDKPLLNLADIVKVEVGGSKASLNNLRMVANQIDRSRCILLAEKVETEEAFQKAKELGCRLFQGYFFAKPVLMAEQTVNPLRMNYLRLIMEASRPDVDFRVVADIIKQDVGLSYKILRLVNSAYFGLSNNVKNIHQAVVFLGSRELRKWISFVSLTNMVDNKPSELIVMSMTRAHFCERVSLLIRRRRDSEAFFLAGMFSLLDVMMDMEMESALENTRIPPVTRKALLEQDNAGRYALDLIRALEEGHWKRADALAHTLKLTYQQVFELYYGALDWSNDLIDKIP